jgi:hypothetical protein
MTKIKTDSPQPPLAQPISAGKADFSKLLRSATGPKSAVGASAVPPKAGPRAPVVTARQAVLLDELLQQPKAPASRPAPSLNRLVRRANQKASATGDTALEVVLIQADDPGTTPFIHARVGSLIFVNENIVGDWSEGVNTQMFATLLERHLSSYVAAGQ